MATRVFNGIKFCEHIFKNTSQGTSLPSLVQIGPAVWEEKMFKEIVDDGHIPTLKAPLGHDVLRWAKYLKNKTKNILKNGWRIRLYVLYTQNIIELWQGALWQEDFNILRSS